MNNDNSFDIVCLSHLKWETTLFQRPQQIMTQLSKNHRIIYISNCKTKEFFLNLLRGNFKHCFGWHNSNLFYLNIPFMPLTKRFKFLQKFSFAACALAGKLLQKRFKFKKTNLWLYYPKYLPYTNMFNYDKLIYDCMDLFKGFKASADDIQILENSLFKKLTSFLQEERAFRKQKRASTQRHTAFPVE